MKACVVIGDIVKSQKVENLPEVIGTLRQTLEKINADLKSELLGQFRIFGGDSFEGCLKSAARAYEVYRRVQPALRPVSVRCVAGLGEVESLADGNVLEMTGPVFVRVSEFLEEAAKPRRGPHVRFHIISDDSERDHRINTIVALIEGIRDSWNDNSYKIADLADEEMNAIAEKTGLTRQAVLKQFNEKNINNVLKGERLVDDLLTTAANGDERQFI